MQKIKAKYHVRVLDQMEIQTYQSRAAPPAEMAANERDANAARAEIALPPSAGPAPEIVAGGNGCGTAFEGCQEKYPSAGCDTRNGGPGATTPDNGPAAGRRSIGNLAGFGIAKKAAAETAGAGAGRTVPAGLPIRPPCGRTGG